MNRDDGQASALNDGGALAVGAGAEKLRRGAAQFHHASHRLGREGVFPAVQPDHQVLPCPLPGHCIDRIAVCLAVCWFSLPGIRHRCTSTVVSMQWNGTNTHSFLPTLRVVKLRP